MNPLFRLLGNGLRHFNRWMAILSAILIAVATLVLVYEVVTRYFLRVTNDWVIELCVFLLIAATFLSAAHTQAERGHVGIEVLDEVMSPYWNRIRSLAGDFLSLVVVAFIANNAWRYTYNAYDQGWETGSTWAPALWIPYFFMAFGLTTLALQIVLQLAEAVLRPAGKRSTETLLEA